MRKAFPRSIIFARHFTNIACRNLTDSMRAEDAKVCAEPTVL